MEREAICLNHIVFVRSGSIVNHAPPRTVESGLQMKTLCVLLIVNTNAAHRVQFAIMQVITEAIAIPYAAIFECRCPEYHD